MLHMQSCLICAIVVLSLQCISARLRLVQVQMIVRHGARSPLEDTYPNDPYKDHNYKPLGYGQLTMRGKRQALKLGQNLRSRYDDLLGDDFYIEKQNLIASELPRTEMTAALLMAGLWPPSAEQMVDPDLLWQPVPYTTRHLLPGPASSASIMTKCQDPEIEKQILATYNNTLSFVMKNSGVKNICSVMNVYTALQAQDSMNLMLPCWVNSVYPDPMNEMIGTILHKTFGGKFVRQRECHILKEMVHSFDAAIAGYENATLFNLYAAHDFTIVQVQVCLNIYRPHIPGFVANMAFELHQLRDSSFGMMILYQTGLYEDLEVLRLPGCDDICPYEKFKQAVHANNILPNYS